MLNGVNEGRGRTRGDAHTHAPMRDDEGATPTSQPTLDGLIRLLYLHSLIFPSPHLSFFSSSFCFSFPFTCFFSVLSLISFSPVNFLFSLLSFLFYSHYFLFSFSLLLHSFLSPSPLHPSLPLIFPLFHRFTPLLYSVLLTPFSLHSHPLFLPLLILSSPITFPSSHLFSFHLIPLLISIPSPPSLPPL